ncbi:MAG: hypothetical protein R3B54_13325 [Bdellovibrionota bacterium]
MELISLGGSGWPLVSNGAVLRVQSKAKYGFGDLVVFCGARVQVCHRVIGKERIEGMDWYLIKGDANVDADGWVPAYRILGWVETVDGRPASGWFLRAASLAMASASLLQWRLYEWLFLSSVGVKLRRAEKSFGPHRSWLGHTDTFRHLGF